MLRHPKPIFFAYKKHFPEVVGIAEVVHSNDFILMIIS